MPIHSSVAPIDAVAVGRTSDVVRDAVTAMVCVVSLMAADCCCTVCCVRCRRIAALSAVRTADTESPVVIVSTGRVSSSCSESVNSDVRLCDRSMCAADASSDCDTATMSECDLQPEVVNNAKKSGDAEGAIFAPCVERRTRFGGKIAVADNLGLRVATSQVGQQR